MDINTIERITVAYKNGQVVVYEKRGLEKFRRQIGESPPLSKKKGQIIIDSDPEEDPIPPPEPQGRNPPQKANSSYHIGGFEYTAGLDPKDMMAQAAASGLQFGH